MSLAQRSIRQMGALARKIKRNAPKFERINEQAKVLAKAHGSQKLVLSAQRQTDPSFGISVLAQKIEIAKLVARDITLARVVSGSGHALQATINTIGLAEMDSFRVYADAPSGIFQVTTIQPVAGNDGSLNNKYFLINSANNNNQYYVWFNVGGNGLDPMVSNRTGLPVNIYTNSSAAVIGAALAPVLSAANGTADFSASANLSTGLVTVTYKAVGAARAPTDGNPALSSASASAIYVVPASLNRGTGFTYAVPTFGQVALALASKYFVLNDSNGTVAVWYNVGGSGTAPAGFHRTLEVSVASLASSSTVATATAAVLSADSKFSATASGFNLAVTNLELGNFGSPSNGTSTFKITNLQSGSINMENLLNIKPNDLMEIRSGSLNGQFFTIASITNNVILTVEDAPTEAGETGISARFEMRTTIPASLEKGQQV